MRLIDADALDVEKLDCYYGSNCTVDAVEEWIKDAPTVNGWIRVEDEKPPIGKTVLLSYNGLVYTGCRTEKGIQGFEYIDHRGYITGADKWMEIP